MVWKLSATLQNIVDDLTKCDDTALIPDAHEAYVNAMLQSSEYYVVRRGLGGYREVRRSSQRAGDDHSTVVNVDTGACQGRSCSRTIFLKTPCKHLLCAYCEEGLSDRPEFFEERWPKRFLRAHVLSLVGDPTMTFHPPTIAGRTLMDPYHLRPAPPRQNVTKKKKRAGRPGNNNTRYKSTGDKSGGGGRRAPEQTNKSKKQTNKSK